MRFLTVLFLFHLLSTVYAGFPEWSPTFGVKGTSPQKLSLSLGISNVPWGGYFGGDTGLLFRLEPGLAGWKVHLGIRNTFSMIFFR